MEFAARAVTPTSSQASEAETDQESDSEEYCIESWPSETESSVARSPLQGGDSSSPSLEPASVSLGQCEGAGEESKNEFVVLDLKEEGKSPSFFWEQNDSKHLANKKQAVNETDLEKGLNESQTKQDEGECRVCHLAFDSELGAGGNIKLGCDCKDDLSVAHRHCAEAWFKIKGNRTCEICGATAQNVLGVEEISFIDHWNNRDGGTSTVTESGRCWQGQPMCNFLLACMVVAFILPWLLRVSIF